MSRPVRVFALVLLCGLTISSLIAGLAVSVTEADAHQLNVWHLFAWFVSCSVGAAGVALLTLSLEDS